MYVTMIHILVYERHCLVLSVEESNGIKRTNEACAPWQYKYIQKG